MLATLRKFGDLVQSYQIIRWEQVGPSYRLRVRLLRCIVGPFVKTTSGPK